MAQSDGSGSAPAMCHTGLRGVCVQQDLVPAAHCEPSVLPGTPASDVTATCATICKGLVNDCACTSDNLKGKAVLLACCAESNMH